MNDLKFALRQLLKHRGFTAVAVLTLALGIGANTVVFTVAKAVLFRPLGFEAPERLMWIRQVNRQTGVSEDRLSWRELEDIRESTRSFETVSMFGAPGFIWEQGDRLEEVSALGATADLAETLAIRPALGRLFQPADRLEGAELVVLLGYELWQSRFGGSPNVLGQTVRLDQKPRTIVGVLPQGLQFPLERAPTAGTGTAVTAGPKAFWFPMRELRGPDRTSRAARMFVTLGRLKAKVTPEAARAEMTALGQRLAADFPETNRNLNFELVSLRDQVLGRTRHTIPVLAAAVAAVLLICCVNLANLLLARGVSRQREMALRLALGASRRRLVQALLTESVLLSLLGGGLGIAVAHGTLYGIRRLGAANVPFIHEATVDGGALLFTGGLALLTGLLFGLLPAWRHSHAEPAESLQAGARTTPGPQLKFWQHGLLVAQVAVVLVLLVSGSLLLESFRRLTSQDLGYKPHAVTTLDLSMWDFQTNEEVCRLYRSLHARLAALPGVEAVGTVSSAPLTGKWTFQERVQVAGQPVPAAERPSLAATFVAFDYFKAMGIPLLEGRYFRDSEMKDNGYGQLVVLNQSAAALLFPNRSAIGGRFTVGSNPERVLEVIGVVKDTRDVRLEESPQPRFYWQYAFGGAQVVVRSTIPSRALMPLLLAAVQQTDPRIIRQSIQPMREIVSATVAERRFLMTLLTAYAVLAFGIATVGVFGVTAYQVAQRTNEFGVRLALGASPRGLLRLVLMQSARLLALGLLIGLAMSFATSRLLVSQLFQLSPHDPALLMTVSVLLLFAGLLATIVPARRAARVNPMVALRCD